MFTEKDSEIGTIAAIGPLGNPSHSKYERLRASEASPGCDHGGRASLR
jgi:hypothetical protein